MKRPARRSDVAFVVNTLGPANTALISAAATAAPSHSEFIVLTGADEDNRGNWTDMDRTLAQNGVRVDRPSDLVIPYRRRTATGLPDRAYLHVPTGLLGALWSNRPRAIVSNEMGLRSLIALVYGRVTRTPVWIWWGGTTHTEQTRGMARRTLRQVIVKAKPHWLSYGRSSTTYLCSLGVDPEEVTELQHTSGQTGNPAQEAPTHDLQPKPVLLCVSQLIARKGLPELLDALGRAQSQGRLFSTAIVGDGPLRSALEAQASSLHIEHLTFLGSVHPDEMPGIYRSADVLLFPTLEDVWGLVVNEALSAGLPVLSSIYAGSTEELIAPEHRFDPLSPASIDRAVVTALDVAGRPADRSGLIPVEESGRRLAEVLRTTLQPEPAEEDASMVVVPSKASAPLMAGRYRATAPIRLQIGAFDCAVDGWLNTDVTPHIFLARIPQLTSLLRRLGVIDDTREAQYRRGTFGKLSFLDLRRPFPLRSNSVEAIYAEHVLEHLELEVTDRCLAECHRVLEPGGVLRISVPDLDDLIRTFEPSAADNWMLAFLESSNSRAKNRHKWHFNFLSLERRLEQAGFRKIDRRAFQNGACPDLLQLEHRTDSLFVEAVK